MIAEYFRLETAKLTKQSLAEIQTKADWEKHQATYRKQLFEMLGLDPLPKRTPLKPVVTGKLEHDEFIVEKVHFQSRPGLYVTGNFYLPKTVKGKLPTILYVCGHGREKKNGVSFGNKTHYQHHGAWFARNGYACLTIDTLQMGEIEGIHHGTYNHKMWWWNARGYSSAAVEAWNCIRALDYLETRPEVDADKFGVTGRSGGGAYSWWIAALDERIKVAVPVAGITSLHNHVVDGCVEGHCDCMYPVNTYRWDFANIAALVAPRALLISNTDKDRIFPLDGVVDVYSKTRRIYKLLGAEKKIGLQITEGPHSDTQNLRIHAFHWFNEHLQGQNPSPLIETAAVKFFDVEKLRVFPVGKEPKDEINTTIQETFVPKAVAKLPKTQKEWDQQTALWKKQLRDHCFRAWPEDDFPRGEKLDVKEVFSEAKNGIRLTKYEFASQNGVRLDWFIVHRDGLKPKDLEFIGMNVVNNNSWDNYAKIWRLDFPQAFPQAGDVSLSQDDLKNLAGVRDALDQNLIGIATFAPRGFGPTRWKQDERSLTQIRRRFMLLGQTQDSMRVWDTRRVIQSVRSIKGFEDTKFQLQGKGETAGIVLYAALFEPGALESVSALELNSSHQDGPIFLNVLRFLDLPQTVAMVAEHTKVSMRSQKEIAPWEYPLEVVKTLGWENRLSIRDPKKPK